jgi:hypothetical protein
MVVTAIRLGKSLAQIKGNPSLGLQSLKEKLMAGADPDSSLAIRFSDGSKAFSLNHNCDSDSIFGWGSITKIVTAALCNLHLPDLTEKVNDLCPFLFEEHIGMLTIQQLLNHTSGLIDYALLETNEDLNAFFHAESVNELIELMKRKNTSLNPSSNFLTQTQITYFCKES